MSLKFDFNERHCGDKLIFSAIEAVKDFSGITQANRYLEKLAEEYAEFVRLNSNVYRYKDYWLNVGKRIFMAAHADAVMSISGWDKIPSCAPIGVVNIWLDNGEDMLLITRIPGSENRLIKPYSELDTSDLRDMTEAKRCLLADADLLMEHNYACIAITEGTASWYIIDKEQHIIISDWQLAFLPDAAKPAYRRRVLSILEINE